MKATAVSNTSLCLLSSHYPISLPGKPVSFAFSKPNRTTLQRLRNFAFECVTKNTDANSNCLLTEHDVEEDCTSNVASACETPFVHLSADILKTELELLKDDPSTTPLLTLPVLREEEQKDLSDIPAHPIAMKVLYASFFAGNVREQLWNFTWPAAMAMLYPSLLPVASLGFFTKLAVFMVGPLVGNVMDMLPRLAAYHYLILVQTAAHLFSGAMITYAFSTLRNASVSDLLLQPWFVVLVIASVIDKLATIAVGVAIERDWVVQLVGRDRPIALTQANATLGRIDLLCETAAASVFAILLTKYDPPTCIQLSCALSICSVPLLIIMSKLINQLSNGALGHITFSDTRENSFRRSSLFNLRNIVEDSLGAIKHGWTEYKNQPVLPASLAYVLLCFNIALAPGALMTTFLMHQGVSVSIIGGFGVSSALVGILATFLTANLVKKLGILKAGAAGLITQGLLLSAAVAIYLSGSISQQTALFTFLGLIALSRLGNMAFSVIGLQIVQTGNPIGKAKVIGVTEISLASLTELAMMGVAMIARDASHFGYLALLSAASVVAAAILFCNWLAKI